ncbi:Outer membrane protein beta-barrel domain-containing protein [Saccharicrinis carchari]|uniref:Outer membrane protein beta-barrel domain-containing protein n=1 Tax=Saccharicrinis carchari TaxID=1168039 RepID=A0A521CQL0_SACCC|nr:outer membrane beta-barrel protein [Saccharicrinis carchari]SMO61723.1 Outer membrane protein beta-barrel domain-containing protein [Saccharicrinis carchari]
MHWKIKALPHNKVKVPNSENFLSETNNRYGFVGGLSYDYPLKNVFYVGVELLYAQKGFKEDFNFTNNIGEPLKEGTTDSNYSYLSIPLKYGYTFGKKIRLNVNHAIVPSILISAKIKTFSVEDLEMVTYRNTDLPDRIDLAILAEIGCNYKLNEQFLLCPSITYTHSVTNFANKNYMVGSKVRHWGAIFSLGFKYTLRNK